MKDLGDLRKYDFSDDKMLNGIIKETNNFNFYTDAFSITKVHGLITPKNWVSSFEKNRSKYKFRITTIM